MDGVCDAAAEPGGPELTMQARGLVADLLVVAAEFFDVLVRESQALP